MEKSNRFALTIGHLAFLFVIGGSSGWILELVFRSLCERTLVIPGFLLGPCCPIYGFGLWIIMYLCDNKYKWISFMRIFILCSLLEYVASAVYERMYGILLWDYTNQPLHIGTRISLVFSLAWAAMGLFVLVFAVPRLEKLFENNTRACCIFGYSGAAMAMLDMTVRNMLA